MKAVSPSAPVLQVLDDLEVTDTVFHDLKHTSPLTAQILGRIPESARSVLLVGPNVVLAHILRTRGLDVTLWHVHGVAVTEDLVDEVDRRGTVDELLALDGVSRTFDVVVAPYLVDLATPEPVATLRALGHLVNDGGSLLIISDRAGALQHRLDGLKGRAPLGRPDRPGSAPTWSWPAGRRRHLVDETLLTGWAKAAGLRIVESKAVLDRQAVEQISALKMNQWLTAQATHAVKAVAPSVRDTLVATLRPLQAGRPSPALGSDPAGFPMVSVVVFASDAARLASAIADLENQTYPRDRTELILMWPAPGGPVPEVPGTLTRRELRTAAAVPSAAAANEALAASSGDIVAFTSDTCDIPPGWVESGVRELGGWTMAVAGRVLVQVQSAAAFLDLPGRRRYPRPDGLYPWTNSFYVRTPVLEVGGFEDPAGGSGGEGVAGATWGWDTTAAVKLARAGYHIAESNQVYLHRCFPHAPDRGWMREEYEYAKGIPAGLRWEPGLRRALHRGMFATPRTLAFDLMVAGLAAGAVTRRKAPAVLGTLAYVKAVSEYLDVWPPAAWPTTVRHIRGVTIRNAIWSAALVKGSVQARRVVL